MRWLPIALIAAFSLTGCVFHTSDAEGPPSGSFGDITFTWTFAGHSCAQAYDVDRVHVTLDGPSGRQQLESDGYFKCSPAGIDGIRLLDFAPGSYTFRVDALDFQGSTLYTANGNLYVNGDVYRSVDLLPVSSQGRMQVFWQFRDANNAIQPCSGTGIADGTPVTKIRVYINNEPAQDLQCTQADTAGNPVQGWAWSKNPGTYQVAIDGIIVRSYTDPTSGQIQQQEQLWYSASQTLSVIASQTQNVTFDMLPVASGAHFVPHLIDARGRPYTSCAAAGVRAFQIQLTDSEGNSTTPFFSANCDQVLVNGFIWDYLPAFQSYDLSSGKWRGSWTVMIEAWDKAESVHNVVGTATQTAILTAGYRDLDVPIDIVR
ncbi:MAG: hypothetical protein HY901_00280 [Deltaproteobacteria bacterium]|nr:hypothetical protein [Deltaproteobacteria bacterium]